MDNIRTWVLASTILTAAACYILWGPSDKVKKKKGWVAGLENPGKTCFLNAVLQALAACDSFVFWLSQGPCHGNSGLFAALYDTLVALNEPNLHKSALSPTPVILALRANRWVINNEEQDAHELYHVLTSTLEEEAQARKKTLSLSDIPSLENSPGNMLLGADRRRASYPIISHGGSLNLSELLPLSAAEVISGVAGAFNLPTRGLLANQLKCQLCGYRYPVCYDTFDSVSLALPPFPRPRSISIHDCLKKFISPEIITDAVCERCSSMQGDASASKTTFIKQLTFGKLPECLCFHLQRTLWLPNMATVKQNEHVSFPEILNMDAYIFNALQMNAYGTKLDYPWVRLMGRSFSDLTTGSPKSPLSSRHRTLSTPLAQFTYNSFLQNGLNSHCSSSSEKAVKPFSLKFGARLYRLKAVIVHQGDMRNGHFLTYRRGPQGSSSEWFCASDSTVRKVSLSEVLHASAFMLFYEALSLKK